MTTLIRSHTPLVVSSQKLKNAAHHTVLANTTNEAISFLWSILEVLTASRSASLFSSVSDSDVLADVLAADVLADAAAFACAVV